MTPLLFSTPRVALATAIRQSSGQYSLYSALSRVLTVQSHQPMASKCHAVLRKTTTTGETGGKKAALGLSDRCGSTGPTWQTICHTDGRLSASLNIEACSGETFFIRISTTSQQDNRRSVHGYSPRSSINSPSAVSMPESQKKLTAGLTIFHSDLHTIWGKVKAMAFY